MMTLSLRNRPIKLEYSKINKVAFNTLMELPVSEIGEYFLLFLLATLSTLGLF
jgi:hypothetical protein